MAKAPTPQTGRFAGGPSTTRPPREESEAIEVDVPSDLDDLTHAELIEIYRDTSANIRFSKGLMWQLVLYFSVGTVAVTAYGEVTNWSEPVVSQFLLVIVWIFSISNILILLSLQWWQNSERRKITELTKSWSTTANRVRQQRSRWAGEVQRYSMLFSMLLYLELITIAVTRIFLPHI